MSSSPLRAVVAPSPIDIRSTPGRPQQLSLRLLPLSDLHLTANPTATELLLKNRDYFERMQHVVLLGDQVACYGTDGEYGALNEFLQRLDRRYSPINGNHEFYFERLEDSSPLYGRSWAEASIEAKQSQLDKFRSFFGLETLWRVEQNELGAFIFLGLNGVTHHKAETLSDEQLEFLELTLQANRSTPVYVFCHAPLMLRERLDMEYYVASWTACIEARAGVLRLLEERPQPLLWMSGHVHLRPEHHLFAPYQLAAKVWQIHCPDSWGFSRWQRAHITPKRHKKLFSRHLEIERAQVKVVTHDHERQADVATFVIDFNQ
jgi:hypothetical protein